MEERDIEDGGPCRGAGPDHDLGVSGAPISLRAPADFRKALKNHLDDRPRETRSRLIIDLLGTEMRRFGYLPQRESFSGRSTDPAERLLSVATRLEEAARTLRRSASEC
jgi:hypothetical protein